MNKYGLIIKELKPKDYKFGASPLPMTVIQESGDWSDYLPEREFQNMYGVEPYACVIFTLLNCIEILIKKKYGLERNYSERFLATVVDTRNGGCSPQDAFEFLRKVGVVPQAVWPFSPDVDTTEEFFEPLPPKLYEIARQFLDEWDFKYEAVPLKDESITRALQCSPLLMSVSAWFARGDGIFYRPVGMTDNHATTLFYESVGAYRRVFDSYDNPYIKDYDYSAMPQAVYRFHIEKKTQKRPSLWARIKAFIQSEIFILKYFN